MVRILHSADWHLGQTLRGFSREFEHRQALARLTQIVAEEEVDVLVVAGDIFDSANPSGDAQRLFYETLVQMRQRRPTLKTVLVAGNHDAAGRLEAPDAIFQAVNIHAVGNVRREGGRINSARHLVPTSDASGEVAGHILAVSYPTAARMCNLPRLTGENGSMIVAAVREMYAEIVAASRPALGELPFLVTGHLHVAGATVSEGAERRILVGGEHAVPHDIFPDDAAYIALGHLHKPQAVGRQNVRYSGSLFPLSATEMAYEHGVTLVCLGGAGAVGPRHIPIARPVPFLRIPATGEIRFSEFGDHLRSLGLDPGLPIHLQPYIQVRLAADGLPYGFREEADQIAECFPVRVVDLQVTRAAQSPALATLADPLVRLAERDPEELFKLAFVRKHQAEATAAHMAVFHSSQPEA